MHQAVDIDADAGAAGGNPPGGELQHHDENPEETEMVVSVAVWAVALQKTPMDEHVRRFLGVIALRRRYQHEYNIQHSLQHRRRVELRL